MNTRGYYRFPTISGDAVVFVAEDDLWRVDIKSPVAHRLTASLGIITLPSFSPSGKLIAFVSSEEGSQEVYFMPAEGGTPQRLTYLGGSTAVLGWRDEREILFASNIGRPFSRVFYIYTVDIKTGQIVALPFGPARSVSFGKTGTVIGRNTGDPARWKRYRGGTAGELWIDEKNSGEFHKLIELAGNLADPMWIGNRIYFISDHEGIGNIYSCLPNGKDLKRHTEHEEFYVRNAATDGKSIVYHAGADIYVFDIKSDKSKKIDIVYKSPRTQTRRKFVNASKYLEDYHLSPDGSWISVVTRGKSFTMGNWEGPVIRQGQKEGIRYRLTRWLNDKKHVVLISDEGGEEHLEIHSAVDTKIRKVFKGLDIGRAYDIKVSPARDEILMSNHRNELLWINLASSKIKTIDQSQFGPINGFDWSPCGKWATYSFAKNDRVSVIKVCEIETLKRHEITESIANDFHPVFDPDGRFIYFISNRVFNPVPDSIYFDLSFIRAMKLYAIILRKDQKSPFEPVPHPFKENSKKGKNRSKRTKIDFASIKQRIVPFPIAESIYGNIIPTRDKVFYMEYPVEGILNRNVLSEGNHKGMLKFFDLSKMEENTFLQGVSSFKLSADREAVAVSISKKIRVLNVGNIPSESVLKMENASRKSGWLDLNRIKVPVEPVSEWKQMLREAWRLQRDYFWVEDMSGINWKRVLKRYSPLVERVASRSEFSDLIWEMQGELGTSHAYEFGGDYRLSPNYTIGFLGADLTYDKSKKAFRIERILKGDTWDFAAPPLLKPGLNIKEKMLIVEINGQKVIKGKSPGQMLLNHAKDEVQITVADEDGKNRRKVWVKTLDYTGELLLRYRDWVESNREYVHKRTKGKVGYIHIPDMGAFGYSEFHRYFLTEIEYDGIVIDVRFNGGGYVSQLLLEKLSKKRIGYDLTRWMGYTPYPSESVKGPIIAITNEYAGSDGDIFSHSFKLMKLGKLVGRRTWGGVIGIWPRNWLADGTVTTQPEFSFWFKDVGWGVENYGTEPDIEVDITPQDYVKGKDTQLDRAIREILHELKENPPFVPKFGKRPKLSLPSLDEEKE